MLQRVAVVGAGAAGLCVARHILSRPSSFTPPVVFELTDNVGGTWCYDERVGTYDNGQPIHSSMYRNLRTNLPKEVMMFPDFPFDPQLSSFLPHQEVQRYLERYCQYHNIQPHIRFKTVVENVTPPVMTKVGEEKKTAWEVTSLDSSGCLKTESFDAVFVCSGHYSDPHIPHLPGIENFKGQVLHSHSYRYAEPFCGQSVVVLGAKASGLDISIELAKAGAQVTLSHRYPRLTFPLPPGIHQSSSVVAVENDGSIRFQVLFALAVLDGSVSLPPQEQMEEEVWQELQEKEERGVAQHHLLKMDKDQWEYCKTLACSAGFPPLPPVVRSLYEEVWRQRQIHPQNYRRLNYRLVSDTRWELVD
ncbi:uncharacterized protein LOC133459976 isoform X2 [Cololabis saira]|uniref:uncharacterized protein LOC133459976 isoform X2 n=1 Tax=Cololabis saira TaxID=129043 RepID=UPI002AD29178|nr:uncharacterized protein LOC133459976 isoform X2 [Cololabis saira]